MVILGGWVFHMSEVPLCIRIVSTARPKNLDPHPQTPPELHVLLNMKSQKKTQPLLRPRLQDNVVNSQT